MTEDKIDLSPYNLLIATPMASGKPDDTYNTSLDQTRQMIRHYGGKVENFKTKWVADISLARSKLFGAFLRNPQYTHLLMIDDDMGWKPEEVAWFLLLNRDFLAAVGPKKKYPIEFAFNAVGDDGKIAPLYHELETNVTELPFVGGAFVMISRDCAEKMAAAYPELQYEVDPGVTEYAVFDPKILHSGDMKRRLSDDYAFCYRWRKIGGKIYVKLDVELQHSGNHTFSGNLLDYFVQTEPSFSNSLKIAAGNVQKT